MRKPMGRLVLALLKVDEVVGKGRGVIGVTRWTWLVSVGSLRGRGSRRRRVEAVVETRLRRRTCALWSPRAAARKQPGFALLPAAGRPAIRCRLFRCGAVGIAAGALLSLSVTVRGASTTRGEPGSARVRRGWNAVQESPRGMLIEVALRPGVDEVSARAPVRRQREFGSTLPRSSPLVMPIAGEVMGRRRRVCSSRVELDAEPDGGWTTGARTGTDRVAAGLFLFDAANAVRRWEFPGLIDADHAADGDADLLDLANGYWPYDLIWRSGTVPTISLCLASGGFARTSRRMTPATSLSPNSSESRSRRVIGALPGLLIGNA